MGEHKFIYLPQDEGQMYIINMQGTGTGMYTIKSQNINNGQIISTEVFSNLPVTPALTGQIILDPVSNATTLSVEQNPDSLPAIISPDVPATVTPVPVAVGHGGGALMLNLESQNKITTPQPQVQKQIQPQPQMQPTLLQTEKVKPVLQKPKIIAKTIITKKTNLLAVPTGKNLFLAYVAGAGNWFYSLLGRVFDALWQSL